MGLTKNLYYEIKDVTIEDRQDGVHAYKQKIRTKVYGLNSTKAVRKLLIDILIDRVENHKDKFLSPIIYKELLGMEIKKNGKTEHSDSTHDDQVFSLLMALYVWYEGTNLAERYGLRKCSIKTDEEIDEPVDYYNDDSVEIVGSFNQNDELQDDIQRDLDAAIKAGGPTVAEFLEKQHMEELAQFNSLANTPSGARAYRQMYHLPKDTDVSKYTMNDPNGFNIPDSVFYSFYNPSDRSFELNYNPDFDNGALPENDPRLMQDENYSYADHFNF